MNIPKEVRTVSIALAGVGAVNWGLNKFLSFNLLNFVPAGIVSTIAYAVITAAGAVVLYELFDGKI
jgi:uncharacterized membrane protein YuzA (DUF378 family)